MTFGSYEQEPIVLDDWQVLFLWDHSRYRAIEKAPQIGFSWLCAAEALWEAIVFGGMTSSFVSVDQREAGEKILYAKRLYYELPESLHDVIKLTKDSVEELWISDRPGADSRLMSIPATAALRGRKTNVYLDEADFYKDGGESMHRVALGRIARGGHVTVGSTCMGIDTQLDRIMAGEERNYSRSKLPWPVVSKPEMLETIEVAFQELGEDDFSEEYECQRGGGMGVSFSPELLRRCLHTDDLVQLEDLDTQPAQVLGMDVGTADHPTVISVLERFGDGVWRQTCLAELRKLSLPKQHAVLNELMARLPTAVLALDATGIGIHIGQALKAKFRRRVIEIKVGSKPEGMPEQSRPEFIAEFKRALESGEVELAADREQMLQFRRTKLLSGGKVEQRGSKHRTHYDRAWATMYAWYGTRVGSRRSIYERRGLRILDLGRR